MESEIVIEDAIIGKRFGLWKVLSFDESTAKPAKKRRYHCKCSCGTEKSVCYHDLIQRVRGSKSCGCRGRKMYQFKTGDIYNRWTVIKEVEQRDGRRIIQCKCTCGWIGLVAMRDLVHGRSRSCGCLRDEEARKRISSNKEKLLT